MDLRNKTTSEFRTVFHSPLDVPNSQVPLYMSLLRFDSLALYLGGERTDQVVSQRQEVNVQYDGPQRLLRVTTRQAGRLRKCFVTNETVLGESATTRTDIWLIYGNISLICRKRNITHLNLCHRPFGALRLSPKLLYLVAILCLGSLQPMAQKKQLRM